MLFALFLTSFGAKASHIVGGDFQVTHVSTDATNSETTYDVLLRVYRDCGASLALDATLDAAAYDLANNGSILNFTLTQQSINQVPLGDECYTPTNLCVEENVYTTTITVPYNPNGFYVTTQLFARNNTITNLDNPGGTGMTFYAEMPDPSIVNSSPDFGSYPTDGYLCVGYEKELEFNISDADGDSLVFSLVDPLDANANGSLPGPYIPVTWAAGYSLADICGGIPPMWIDGQTGIITANPNGLGIFVFSVRVEEYRNGVKIGETRRDMQYAALNCTVDLPPAYAEFQDTIINMPVGSTTCFDVIAQDLDATDTIYMELLSSTLPLGASYDESPLNADGTTHTYYYWDSTHLDSMLLPNMGQTGSQFFKEGTVATRFCWEPTCDHRADTLYTVVCESYSLGCSGSDTARTNLYINVVPPVDQAPVFLIGADTSQEVQVLNTYCKDLIAFDPDPQDTVFIQAYSNAFAEGAEITTHSGEYYYWNIGNAQQDTIVLNAAKGSLGGYYYEQQGVGLRYCWDTECEFLDPTYYINMDAFSIGYCGDTTWAQRHEMSLDVFPIIGENNGLPNVFTPDGDGINDVFKIEGSIEPCFDFMDVKIYSRWGRKVFDSEDPDFVWDGKNTGGNECVPGVYFIVLKGRFGEEDMEKHHTVTLVR